MAVQEVQVRFNPETSIESLGSNGQITNEPVLPSYTIVIPNPRGGETVLTALRADDTSYKADGSGYNDPLVDSAHNDGWMFHVITDGSGNRVTVMMTDQDWARYQTALSDFASAAARNPAVYHPTAASAGFGLFSAQAQAGSSGARAATPFHPISGNLSKMGIGEGGLSSSYNNQDIDIAVYEARTPAARQALLSAGYVEVQFSTLDDNNNSVRVPRFMTPLDAQLYRDMGSP